MTFVPISLEPFGGNFYFSVCQYTSTDRTLFLILTNPSFPLFTHALIIQHSTTHPNSIYIEALDTTGHFMPRDMQPHFTFYLTQEIIKCYNPDFISIFSSPKKEIIFKKSHNNGNKGKLNPKKCMEFWENVVGVENRYTIYKYSRFGGKIPFKSMSEVRFYNDDPKRKMLVEVKSVNVGELFEILKWRRDFRRGGLIYGVRNENSNVLDKNNLHNPDQYSGSYKLKNEHSKKRSKIMFDQENKLFTMNDAPNGNNNNEGIDDYDCKENKYEIKGKIKETINVDSDTIINMLAFLRKSDFSSFDKNKESCKLFCEQFGVKLSWCKTLDTDIVKLKAEKEEVKIQRVQVRKMN